MKLTVKDVRAAIASLPDEAEVVLWIGSGDDIEAVDAGRVMAFGPQGTRFHEAPDSLHIWEDGIPANSKPDGALADHGAAEAPKRWNAVIHYRSEVGVVDVPHEIEELAELQDLVEHGPDWNTIADITIKLVDPDPVGLTVEEAERR